MAQSIASRHTDPFDPVVVSLTLPDYRIDWEAVRAALSPRTRASPIWVGMTR